MCKGCVLDEWSCPNRLMIVLEVFWYGTCILQPSQKKRAMMQSLHVLAMNSHDPAITKHDKV